MNDLTAASVVIYQLSHLIEQRDAVGLETDGFESLKEDMSTIHGLLRHTGDNPMTSMLTDRLDAVAYKMMKELSKPEPVDDGSLLKKVCSFIPSPSCSCSLPRETRDFSFDISVYSSTLRIILKETEEFMSDIELHKSVESPVNVPMFGNDQSLVGRENDKSSLLKQLLADQTSKQVEVMSIVGSLGCGKTTLARSLFNDDSVKQHFDIQGWALVSNVFDETRIATQILLSLSGAHLTGKLFELLEECFSGKKVLLVFDDVWTEDFSKWEPFKRSLRNSAPGSKILVTVGSERVASAACSDIVHTLGPLSNSDCWFLISKGIESKGKAEIPKEMIKIGKKIAKHCKGSPMIAKIVETKLLNKHTPQDWKRVLDTGVLKLEEEATSLFCPFYRSYAQLSPESRLCFCYSREFFPIDHVISVDQLIRLWIAEGYVGYPTTQAEEKVIQVKAMECFNELANHCFFQDLATDSIHKDKITSCRIQGAATEFMVSRYSAYKKFRSFLSFSNRKLQNYYFLKHMQHLRVLVLSSCQLEQLPSEAEGLSLLQYLDLSCNPLKELPETLYKLSSLLFLDVCFCYLLSHLPKRIGEVKSLKHLRVNWTTDDLHILPEGFQKLTLIQTLDVVRIGGKYDSNFKKLKDLNHLEDIRIAIHGRVDFPDVNLENKVELENLEFCFVGDGREPEWAECMDRVVPPPNLQMLKIEDYPGLGLPKWILADSIINKLRRLSIRSASNISSLPSLWKLSRLEFLWLYDIPCLKRLGREFFGFPKTIQQHSLEEENKNTSNDDEELESSDDSEDDEEIGDGFAAFPCLKTLRIEYLQNCETWEDVDVDEAGKFNVKVMPSLEELIIADCPKLQGRPHFILEETPWFKKQPSGQMHPIDDQTDDKPTTSGGKTFEIEEVQF